GGVERIGAANSRSYVFAGNETREKIAPVPDHGAAVAACLEQLADPKDGCLASPADLAAIGFKAVHAKGVTGVQLVDDHVLAAMEAFNDVCPAHNPPYIRAMRQLRDRLPNLPLVAAFETGFHATTPKAHRYYGVPYEWATEYGVERYGFHGASHRYIAGRIAQLMGRDDLRVVSCHLGGSNSLAAIKNGVSLGCTLGMSPQSGLPHNNRVGDFDVFALPAVMKASGLTFEEVLKVLGDQSGFLGLSGVGNDLRDIETAAAEGNERAALAVDVFVGSIRDWFGSFLVRLGGVDALVFTGGIGENSTVVRGKTCAGLDAFGLTLDPVKNETLRGEAKLSVAGSKGEIWTVPTNEEIVVARQTYEKLQTA
ncbi:MAG: acetate/propionate family kinase, partial [Planctomycetia bacterium]